MELKIQAIHFDASQQLEEFIGKKVNKLPKYFDGILSVEVFLKVVKPETNLNKSVQIKLAVPGNDLISEKVADTFEEAIDEAVAALEKQLLKLKEKIRGK